MTTADDRTTNPTELWHHGQAARHTRHQTPTTHQPGATDDRHDQPRQRHSHQTCCPPMPYQTGANASPSATDAPAAGICDHWQTQPSTTIKLTAPTTTKEVDNQSNLWLRAPGGDTP
jgi:hypothetical protein